MIDIKKIRLFSQHYFNQSVVLKGWVKHNRNSKQLGFLVLVDGSTFAGLQVVYRDGLVNFKSVVKLLPGSAVIVAGKVIKNEHSREVVEIIAQKVTIVNLTTADYFLQSKKHSNEFLRTRSDLRARSNLFHAVFKIRNYLIRAIHEFFQREDFLLLNSPVLTQNDCEGAGESFFVHDSASSPSNEFFHKNVILSVSGQLHAEAFAQCFKKVYTFGPTFRADRSNTKVHSSEFWMIEPEVAFADKTESIDLATRIIKDVLSRIYVDAHEELVFLGTTLQIDLLSRIKSIVHDDFMQLTYAQAVEILQQNSKQISTPVTWGDNLVKEHEIYLCHHFQNKPIFITDYPKSLKAFYMKTNSQDPKTVACFDLLFPDIGEVVGGSEREDKYDILLQNAQSRNITPDSIQ